ncbi:protein Wnt-8b-like [Oculina patagonica]
MQFFTVFCVLLVCLMLVFQGDSCGYGGLPLRVSSLHTEPFRSTTKYKPAALRIIYPQEAEEVDSVLSKIVKDGVSRGLEECQNMFENKLWNCPVEMYKKLPIFNSTTLPYATRETCFIHAINAAAITYEITRQCTLGKIPGCGCPSKPPKEYVARKISWRWDRRVCSDNIEFGEKESKGFTDRLENGNDSVGAVNLHNNEVGREVIRTSAWLRCRCHGVNTACAIKTCWLVLPPFKDVVSKLKEKYHNSVRVWSVDNKLRVQVNNHSISFPGISRRNLKLAYLDSSPDLCVRNDILGIPGMLGRSCRSDEVADKCNLFSAICNSCKLKVKIVERYKQVKCRCKFVYCCKVDCEMCTEKYSVMTCSL